MHEHSLLLFLAQFFLLFAVPRFHLFRRVLRFLHLLAHLLDFAQDQIPWVFSDHPLPTLPLHLQLLAALHVPAVELLEALDQRGDQFFCGGPEVGRDQLMNIDALLLEDLLVVGSRGEFCEANGCPLG